MFTGLVTGIGSINHLVRRGQDIELGVRTPFEPGCVKIGDSVAVNGVCLTIEKVQPAGKNLDFTAYVSAETLANSNLGTIKQGSEVNLELALSLGARFGGHIVSGHADGVALVEDVEQIASSYRVRFSCDPALDVFIVNKGSICVDGISLTVNKCGPGYFELNIIPETWKETIAKNWSKGYRANLEVDILGKYVAKMLRLDEKSPDASGQGKTLDLDFFAKNGFN